MDVRDYDFLMVMRYYLLSAMLGINYLADLTVEIRCRASLVEVDEVRQIDLHAMFVNHSFHSGGFVGNSFRRMANWMVA